MISSWPTLRTPGVQVRRSAVAAIRATAFTTENPRQPPNALALLKASPPNQLLQRRLHIRLPHQRFPHQHRIGASALHPIEIVAAEEA